MKTIVVTGINGFIGSSVSKKLLENGHSIIGLSIEERAVIDHPNLRYIQTDLTDWQHVQTIFSSYDIDMLLHFAGIAHVVKGQTVTDEAYKRVNYLVSKNLFRCAAEKNARVFFASSVDVYGACKSRLWSEDAVPVPVSVYAKTKYAAEGSLIETYKDIKDKYLIGRFAPVYSRMNMKDPYKRIYLKYPKITLSLRNNPSYSFLALDNLVDFVASWVDNNNISTNIINVCDSEGIKSREFIELEKKAGRAGTVIRLPLFISRLAQKLSNNLLDSGLNQGLGYALAKLFDPRIIDKTQITKANYCTKDIKDLVYNNLNMG